MRCLTIILLCLIGTVHSYAQKTNLIDVKFDSVKIKAGHFFIIEDSSMYIEKDTVILIADTVDYFQKRHSLAQTKNFYQSIKTKFHNSKFSRLLYKVCFEPKNKEKPDSHGNVEVSEDPYLQYEGKVIGDIFLRSLPIFGSDVDDTTKHKTSFVTNTLNDLHVHTSNSIIRHNLLLKEGRLLHPSELADNERVIRSLRYVKDARIYVLPVENSYKTNLLVVTKDVFPIRLDYHSSSTNIAASIGLSNINLLGQGHELENNLVLDNQVNNKYGYDGFYRIPNIQGTFINGEVNYSNHFRKKGYGVRLFRDFITPDIRYAGGIEISDRKIRELQAFNTESDSIISVEHRSNVQDIWIGKAYRSFSKPPVSKVKERLRMVVAARMRREEFTERPLVKSDSNQLFHNRTTFLTSFGFASRRYFKDRLIHNFGRTEDIPAGNLTEITLGYQMGEYYNRYYVGSQITEGGFIRHFGYLKGTLAAGGFIRDRRFEQGVVKMDAEYFTHLYTLHFFKIRQFIKLGYTLGIRRFARDVIDISDENGIRGLTDFFLTGRQRLRLDAETVVFTPLHFIGFRVAVFGFYDYAIIGSNNKGLFKGEKYQGYGFGFRLKNDNLAINTIQLRFAYYPTVPFGGSPTSFDFSTNPAIGLSDFNLSTPQILDFN